MGHVEQRQKREQHLAISLLTGGNASLYNKEWKKENPISV